MRPRPSGSRARGGRRRRRSSAGASGSRRARSRARAEHTLGPQELVEDSAKRMLEELDANRADVRQGSGEARRAGRQRAAAEFRTEYAARLVLGQTWRTATAEQRKRFVDAFYHSLLHNYGNALVNFTADNFRCCRTEAIRSDTQATVRTEVKKVDGEKVPVDFSLRKTDAGWKAWDVVIEGISYVKSFRTDFAAEIQQKGLDEVIARHGEGGRRQARCGRAGSSH